MPEFNISEYIRLLHTLKKSGYRSITISSYLAGDNKEPFVILRHDIDRRVHKALVFSQVESENQMVSSYYFRIPMTFYPKIIQKIGDKGHEIGYHYEVLSSAKGDPDIASTLFSNNLQLIRKIYPVKTVCMHGAPLCRYDNRNFWKFHSLESFGLSGEAYLSIKNVEYYSDTGRTWSPKNKIRDRLDTAISVPDIINSTSDLIKHIKEKRPPRLYLLTHPERWAESRIEWYMLYGVDCGVNIIKKIISFSRN